MMLMRTGKSIRPEYLMHVLNSPGTTRIVRELTGGTASPHLNVGDIKRFSVQLPPINEQDEIIRREGALSALADKIESRLKATTTHVEEIAQAILAKAFRGELVPTQA
jgi:type I restriction enzyme, S subunit